ncbi:MAG: hypothetical protein H0T79_20120, partial [Deltaproteobacteria bacterium]|nr:hypothetical protein [Deltaproteobacteria bacterium]
LALACELEHPVHLTLSRSGRARIAAIGARLAVADDRGATILTRALARIGPDGASALFDALSLPNAPARGAAATALMAMGVAGAHSAITQLASEETDPDVLRICAALAAG